jgi:hypothetical protein
VKVAHFEPWSLGAITPPPAGHFNLDTFSSSAPAQEVKVTGHDNDDIEKFESSFPELDVPQVQCCGCINDARDTTR